MSDRLPVPRSPPQKLWTGAARPTHWFGHITVPGCQHCPSEAYEVHVTASSPFLPPPFTLSPTHQGKEEVIIPEPPLLLWYCEVQTPLKIPS